MSDFKNINYSDTNTTVNINLDRFNSQYKRAQVLLDYAVVKDSTPYVPMRTGTLYKSATTATLFGSGEVIWDTPYARECYYGVNRRFRPDFHPQAQAQWFEAAKAINLDNWLKTAKGTAGGG